MGKGHFRARVLFGPSATRKRGCIGCRRPIVYGDRCEDCKRRVRQRQRRKPR
jgi:hypothetical protein